MQVVAPQLDQFGARLQALLERGSGASPVIGGTLELPGLEEMSSLARDSRVPIKDRVRQAVERELQTQLGPGGFYAAYNATTFLMCFTEQEKAEAEQKAGLIAQRLSEAVLNEYPAAQDKLRPAVFVASLDQTALNRDGGTLVDRVFASLLEFRKKAERAAGGGLSLIVDRTALLFAPSWSVSRDMVAFNRCMLDAASQARAYESLQTEPSRGGSALAGLDYLMLAKAAREIQAMALGGRLTPLLVPVKYNTLSDEVSLRTYVAVIQAMPEAYRRLLCLQMVDIPANQPPATVLDVARTLTPWVKRLSLSFDLEDARIADCAKAPVWALAADMSRVRSTDSSLYPQLRRFQAIAAAASMNTLAHGVNSIGLALVAVKAGITYIDGSAIHPVVREPRAVGPLKPVLSALSSTRVVKRWQQ